MPYPDAELEHLADLRAKAGTDYNQSLNQSIDQSIKQSTAVYRDIGMLADQEIEARLTNTVSGLRRGIASARGLHASLRSEAKALDNFIPMLVEGARSGITSLLKHQVIYAAPTAHSVDCTLLSEPTVKKTAGLLSRYLQLHDAASLF